VSARGRGEWSAAQLRGLLAAVSSHGFNGEEWGRGEDFVCMKFINGETKRHGGSVAWSGAGGVLARRRVGLGWRAWRRGFGPVGSGTRVGLPAARRRRA
jgi:hypothetical protein